MPKKSRTSNFKFQSAAATLLALGMGSAFGLDLSTAAKDALSHDAAFLAARKKAEADATRAGQGRGLLLPTATATASRAQTDFNVTNGSALSYANRLSTTYVVSLTQPIFRLERLATFNQEKERSRAGEANFAQARIDALLRVTQAYFDVLIAQDSLASVDAELKAIGEQLESAKRNFEVGTATITDQQEAQARFDLATAKQIAARNDLEVKRSALSILVGKALPQRLLGLRNDVSLQSPEPLDVAKWIDQSRSANLRVQAAQSAAEIARYEVTRITSADNVPTLDLVAQKRRVDPFTLSSNVYPRAETDVLSLELSIPIFNGGIPLHRAREAIALRDKASFDLENERRTAEQTTRTAFLGVLAGLSQVKAFEAAEKSSRLALESNLLGYEVGVRINIDVLNAQQQLFTTQRDLSKARYDTLLNSLRLKAAAGALADRDIDDVNGLLAK
ncbi:MAG: channel protein TolC [Betaproteobacteria bacterium]|jgi:outer membrane protein|nr:channel protein TolC [Betaproteobacteria bacterium]